MNFLLVLAYCIFLLFFDGWQIIVPKYKVSFSYVENIVYFLFNLTIFSLQLDNLEVTLIMIINTFEFISTLLLFVFFLLCMIFLLCYFSSDVFGLIEQSFLVHFNSLVCLLTIILLFYISGCFASIVYIFSLIYSLFKWYHATSCTV